MVLEQVKNTNDVIRNNRSEIYSFTNSVEPNIKLGICCGIQLCVLSDMMPIKIYFKPVKTTHRKTPIFSPKFEDRISAYYVSDHNRYYLSQISKSYLSPKKVTTIAD